MSTTLVNDLTWFKSPKDLLSRGEEGNSMEVKVLYKGPHPYMDNGEIGLASSLIQMIKVGDDKYITTLLCRKKDDDFEWSIHCGEQNIPKSHIVTFAKAIKSEGIYHPSIIKAIEKQSWYQIPEDAASCSFFKMVQRTAGRRFCSHTAAALNLAKESDLLEMKDELVEWGTGASLTEESTVESEEEQAFYETAFTQPVLLVGERGSGKTYLARQAAEKFDAVFLEMQLHPSMEAWEFRAHDRAWNGKVYTVLGKLAEAVYWIQKGKKVILFMDEFLNMNPMYATVINSPLSLTSRDTYIIETGRIIDQGDGIGIMETVEVPSDMLWVVAAANLGARYNTEITPSVRARFMIIPMNTNPERTKSIIAKTLEKFDMPTEFAEMFYNFIKHCKDAVDQNLLNEEATTRLASNVVRSVALKAKRNERNLTSVADWLPLIKKQVLAESCQVVNIERGFPDPEQSQLYSLLVDQCFSF